MRKERARAAQGPAYLTFGAACPFNPAWQGVAVDTVDSHNTVEDAGTEMRLSKTSPDDIASMDPPRGGKAKDENDGAVPRGGTRCVLSLGSPGPRWHPQPPVPLDKGAERR